MPFDPGLLYQAVESVLTFFLMGYLGYWLAKRGWFSRESRDLLTRLVTQVTLPVYLLWNINTFMTKDQLSHLAYGLPLPAIAIVISLILGVFLVRALKVPASRQGTTCVIIAFSNTIYIGVPVNQALFGDESLPYALLYYFANTTLFWTIGNYLISADGAAERSGIFSRATLKKIMSPPMYGFLGGLALLFLDLRLPAVLSNTARMIGGLTTPIVMITIGVTLQNLGLGKLRFTREIWSVVLCRFLVSPGILIVLMAAGILPPLPELMRKVFIIQASLPAMSTVPMLAAYYRADAEAATVAVSVTTLLAIVTIPIYMVAASL